ncbi:TetR/AcrR family transcriptional regulator [Streptomyces sp. NPDC005209]|uniref:TetR/AcrR family transcriptional regulator n=1 Tax=Streptomyces sp. NPDC005209 TaxID=3156715 RepID=UPI00339FC686
MTFQRARNQEQREIRRQAILDTAAAMLDEMPVSAISLNELSRRVGLAKSNVLRYFESREAVLLDLLVLAARTWLDEAAERLPARIDAGAGPRERADTFAADLADSLASRRVLSDLISAQAGVLEHNVSTEVALRYKRAALEGLIGFADLIRRALPELDQDAAAEAAHTVIVLIGALWTHSHPAPAVKAAYEADPSLVVLRLDFTEALGRSLAVYLTGLLARAGY